MRFEMWKSKAQKGAFLVFTALMIPIIFLCAGFAVDLGNAWAYKSKLQNAADAAALAGAKEYGDNGMQNKDDANQFASKYISANLSATEYTKHLKKEEYAVQTVKKDDQDNTYFHVHLAYQSDTSFMKMFGYDYLNINVVSTALVPVRAEPSDNPTDEITFDNLIYAGNSIGGSYYNGFLNDITATFDGHVVVYNDYEYRQHLGKFAPDWMKNFYQLPTLNARGKRGNDLDKNDPTYYQNVINGARDENGNLIYITDEDGYWVDPYTYFNKKVTKSIQNIFNSGSVVRLSGRKGYSFNNGSITSDYYLVSGDGTQTVDLYLGSIPGTKPVYIYVDDSTVAQIHLYIKGDVGAEGNRPIIFCYTGVADIKVEGQNSQNSHNSYRGVIYAPYSSQLGPMNNISQFFGSMVAENFSFQTNNMDYRFEQFGIPSGGSSGGGGHSGNSSTDLKLVIDEKEGLSWNDT